MTTGGGRPAFDTPDHRSIGKYTALRADLTEVPVPDAPWRTPASAPVAGRCGCTCGALSEILPTRAHRQRWHQRHREEAGGAPWSDGVMMGERVAGHG